MNDAKSVKICKRGKIMVFSSLVFLYLFLPLCLLLYFAFPQMKVKNAVLIVASLVFYAWGEPIYILLMIASALVNYVFGLLIYRCRGGSQQRPLLIASVVINLFALVYFKYAGFLVGNLNSLLHLSLTVPELALPIGISFYTFQAMSYTIDVYRGEVPVQRSFWRFLLYISLFPQLIAGPIVRYSEIAPQLESRTSTADDVFRGVFRFCIGLGKKVLIANYAGKVASSLLDGAAAASTLVSTWFGVLMFAFQIYFDFSGYSDMAIGLGEVFGFRYAENFNLPYISRSITEFWRRWHISLSSFFRDYVYIPLGGNRRHQTRNLLVVWALTGLWHGASWNFLLWGLYFFVLLAMEKSMKHTLEKIPSFLRRMVTMFLLLIGWTVFYYTDLSQLWAHLRLMFGAGELSSETVRITMLNNLPLLIVCVLGSTPLPRIAGNSLRAWLENNYGKLRHARQVYLQILMFVFDFVVLMLSTVSLVGSTYNPFLYFRF